MPKHDENPSTQLKVENMVTVESPGGTKTFDFNFAAVQEEKADISDSGEAKLDIDERFDLAKYDESDDEDNHALRAKYGLEKSPEEQANYFDWDSHGSNEIQKLTQENAELTYMLNESTTEIQRLNQEIEVMEPIPGLNMHSIREIIHSDETSNLVVDVRDSKIVQLAKKSRNLNILLQKEKSRNHSLSKQLTEKEKELKKQSNDTRPHSADSASGGRGLGDSDGRSQHNSSSNNKISKSELQIQLSNSTNSVKELQRQLDVVRAKLSTSTGEIKRLKTAFIKEVGTSFDLSEIDRDDSKWRGRAKQIAILKAKVKRLSEQLDSNKASSLTGSGSYISGKMHRDVDRKAKAEIAQIEGDRRGTVEELTVKYSNLQSSNKKLSKQLMGSKARIKILEDSVKKQVNQIKTLLEKVSNDDDLIAALREELKSLRIKLRKIVGSTNSKNNINNNPVDNMLKGNNSDLTSRSKQHSSSRSNKNMEKEIQLLTKRNKDVTEERDNQKRLVESLKKEMKEINYELQETHRERLKFETLSKNLIDVKNSSVNNKHNHEAKRLKDLVELYKSKYDESESKLENLIILNNEVERRCLDLERQTKRRSYHNNKPATSTSKENTNSKIHELKLKLKSSTKLREKMQEAFQNALRTKDQELVLLRSSYDSQMNQHTQIVKQLKDSLLLNKTTVNSIRYENETNSEEIIRNEESMSSILHELKDENSFLKEKLIDIKQRYKKTLQTMKHNR